MVGITGKPAVCPVRGRFGNLQEINEVHAAHRFADPIGRPTGHGGEPGSLDNYADFLEAISHPATVHGMLADYRTG